MNEKIEKILKNLKYNNMNGYFVKDKTELINLLNRLIKEGNTVGCGDSVTLQELGVFDYLRNGKYKFLDKHDESISKEGKRKIYLENFSADTFITGTNAITIKGEIFNIDGNGSRVAPMIYGPEQVIIVVGINKIADSLEEAAERVRQVAAPLDAKRLGKNTPCTKINKCIDCKHKERICNDFVLISHQFNKDRVHVIIIDEVVGF